MTDTPTDITPEELADLASNYAGDDPRDNISDIAGRPYRLSTFDLFNFADHYTDEIVDTALQVTTRLRYPGAPEGSEFSTRARRILDEKPELFAAVLAAHVDMRRAMLDAVTRQGVPICVETFHPTNRVPWVLRRHPAPDPATTGTDNPADDNGDTAPGH